ncbi:MAG: hypothetical protein IKS92_05140 [Victivallales bacterium]|nr:hypothetical protein [Victivallales bacterium]MBR4370409.1 hypothetical protein [Victivallales bacterium]MBR5025776.1 hypothetical protein [Victivallales bacterium]MBR5080034.1 hypothetical protein [Victivallales bacterium]
MNNIAVTNVTAWDANPTSLLDNDPQLIATSHSYAINWNGVQFQDLSVSRLLLLISISRAEAAEAILQNEMEMLTRQTALLDSSCKAMELLVSGSTVQYSTSFTYTDVTGSHTTTLGNYLQNVLEISVDNFYQNVSPWGEPQITSIIAGIKNRQDELNSISQKTTINMKDLVTKRDQAYLMETNALKRLMKDAESTAYNI